MALRELHSPNPFCYLRRIRLNVFNLERIYILYTYIRVYCSTETVQISSVFHVIT